MVYFNADGNESTMCGNGGRCIVAFAKQLGIIKQGTTFLAIDGPHDARIEGVNIYLKMQSVNEINVQEEYTTLDTGSPHYVTLKSDIVSLDVKKEGKKIRSSSTFIAEGINVNFVEQLSPNTFAIRTYERGVEDETLSCGTGATAAAIAMHKTQKTFSEQILLETKGGELDISFKFKDNIYQDVWLSGSAELVFDGAISI
jgi:diaminopimelate epimerase